MNYASSNCFAVGLRLRLDQMRSTFLLILPLLGLAPPSAASVIVNPVNVTRASFNSTAATYTLDVNGDGITDFRFSASLATAQGFPGFMFGVTVAPQAIGDAYVGAPSMGTFPNTATALAAGTLIGNSSLSWLPFPGVLQETFNESMFGPWPKDGSFAFLGVRFVDGSSHTLFGWVLLRATISAGPQNGDPSASFTILSAAYETTGAGIMTTPEPSYLGLILLAIVGTTRYGSRGKPTHQRST